MRRRFISNKNSGNNIIRYTSTDGSVVIPHIVNFGTSLVSNTYTDKGLMVFETNVRSIGDWAFYYCTSLTSIQIPNSVTSIGYRAFEWCSSLTSIEIPNSVTSIGDWAFYYCTSLTSIQIPNSVIRIGAYAFGDCTSLKSIQIPNSVTSIGDDAFNRCSSLTSIVVDSGNTKYDSRNGCNAIIETASNTLIAGCQNTIIPNSVTSIGNDAFYYCSSLTSIEIPNSVRNIKGNAFFNCDGLSSVYIKATTPPTLGNFVFDNNSSNRKIYVPRASLNAYKTASGWSNYASAIEPYDY